jgi:hypothetical protein
MAKVKRCGGFYIHSPGHRSGILTLAQEAQEQEIGWLEGGHRKVHFRLRVGREDVLPDEGAKGFDGDAQNAGGFGFGVVTLPRAWQCG